MEMNNIKKFFAECRLELVKFDVKDVITTSGDGLGFELPGDDLSDLSFE